MALLYFVDFPAHSWKREGPFPYLLPSCFQVSEHFKSSKTTRTSVTPSLAPATDIDSVAEPSPLPMSLITSCAMIELIWKQASARKATTVGIAELLIELALL